MKLFLCALLLAVVSAAAGQEITLVKNGRSDYAIVIPPDAPPAIQHGAQELQRFLKQMSGAELPILTEDEAVGAGDHVIRIEQDPALGEEELRIRTEPPRLILSGGGKRGALYACYALLEDVLGCRWYTARISKIPKSRTIALGPLDIHQKPAFEYREPYYTESLDRDWAVRNRTNGSLQHLDESVGGRVAYGKFVHTFNDLVPPDVYFDKHPEYFSLINGKRMKGYYQLCLTNPDVLKIVIAKVEEWIKENPNATIFSVSQNDTYNNCQCDNCKAVEKEEGAPSGVLLRFVNAVADAIAKDHPNVLIDTLAYQWSEDPPLHARPRPNVRIRLAPIGACVSHAFDKCDANTHVYENLTAWSKITDQLYIWHYSTNFANYLQPLPDLDEIAADIPLFKQHGVVGLFYEGDYAPGGGGEMSELKAYLMAKLMWDPTRPAQPIIADFLDGVYGPGAPYIQQWLDKLHAAARQQNVHAHIYDPPTAPYLSPALIAEGLALFDSAEAATASDRVAHDAVQRARLALEYVQLMQTPPSDPAYAARAKGVADKIRKYKIGQVREGEPVAQFLARIERPHPVPQGH
ncbi:MAG TPA: DUF4838 domain-containing protein [Chthonomonadaceae bacterium]|nr:DUF4838 domain-containing protein [Chthonomonadaceae bacterium]